MRRSKEHSFVSNPRVAVTFIALKDEPIGATAIRVRTAAGEEGAIEVTKSECFDAQGEKLEGAAVSLGE